MWQQSHNTCYRYNQWQVLVICSRTSLHNHNFNRRYCFWYRKKITENTVKTDQSYSPVFLLSVTNSAAHNTNSRIYATKNTARKTIPNCGVWNCKSLSTSAKHFSLLWQANHFDTPPYHTACKTEPLSAYPSHMLVCLSAEIRFWAWYSPRYHLNFVSNHIKIFGFGQVSVMSVYMIFVVPSIMLYCSEISPTRRNNCVFILRNGFTLHVSGDNLTHHQQYICCIWPQVSRLT